MTNTTAPPTPSHRPHLRPSVPETPEMRVLLICHAEDMHDRYDHLGNENSGLTAQGWEQADTLASWLRTHELIDVLVSDNLLQCRLTAQRIGQALGLPVSVQRDLPMCTAARWSSDEEDREEARKLHHSVAGSAEEISASELELIAMLDRLLEEHWGATLAIVTCAANISAVLRYLAGRSQFDVQLDPTGISEIDYHNGHWRVRFVNRTPHLPVPVVTPRTTRDEQAQPQDEADDLSEIIAVYSRVAAGDLDRIWQDEQPRVRHLLNFAKLPPGLRVLDVGTGIGLLPLMLAEDGAQSVVGIDISPEMLEQAEYLRLSRGGESGARVNYRLAPAHALPFRDEVFDAVFCRLVLNHTRRPERMVREMVRVLKPGGLLVLAELLSVDNPVKRATQNAIEEKRNPSHVAARSVDQYNKLITDAGLTIEAKETVSFDRELEEWLAAYDIEHTEAGVVREMIEAGLETDAAGIGARRQSNTLVFEQRMYYLKAMKPGPRA